MAHKYVIARTTGKRITVQHRVLETDPTMTQCGESLVRWPWRVYSGKAMSFLVCLRCEPQRRKDFH